MGVVTARARSLAFTAAGALVTLLALAVLGIWVLLWWPWRGAAAAWQARKGRREIQVLPARPLWSAAELAALDDEESLEQLLMDAPLLRREGKYR